MEAKLIIICREVDKTSGKIAVYPLSVMVDEQLTLKLSIRQRLNPELRYYATSPDIWSDMSLVITKQIKRHPDRASAWFAPII